MAITIGTNTSSLKVQRALGLASEEVSTSSERLASGLRINRASDDAAGLAVSSSLKAKTRIYAQAILNANDVLSLSSIAEGTVSQLTAITTRVAELAEQSANGVYSDPQRIALHQEGQALRDEWNRVTRTTTFNGVSLLQEVTTVVAQVGLGTVETLSLTLGEGLSRDTSSVTGDGTFQAAVTSQGFSGMTTSFSADFNEDGAIDIVTANTYLGGVGILLGNGDGTFQPGSSFGSGNSSDVVGGDFDKDGNLDFVTGDEGDNTFSFYKGNGDGTFGARVTFATGDVAGGINLGDFNEDGNLDVIVMVMGTTDRVKYYAGNGNGSFASGVTLSMASGVDLVVADLNNDGNLDIIGGAPGSLAPRIQLGNGDGTFQATLSLALGGAAISVADFDNDGNQDILRVANGYTAFNLGNGDGTFQAVQSFPNSFSSAVDVVTGDLNGDGNVDVIAAQSSGTFTMVNLGNGDGTFQAGTTYTATGGSSYNLLGLADYNNDGALDFSALDSGFGILNVFFANTQESNGVGSSTTLEPFDLRTRSGALATLDMVSTIRDRLAQELGNIGSFQSRIEVTIRNLQTRKENLQAADSRISDANVAEESGKFVRAQITKQAAAAVLAQANQQPALAVQLLGGS